MNIGAPWPDTLVAERRVLMMQSKLHRWAASDPGRRFDDLYNLVYDPAFLVVAWARVRGNKGARTAGVDGVIPAAIVDPGRWLSDLQQDLKTRGFRPDQVRSCEVPKKSGKVRRLGIPTAADRVCQAALKLVLEPVFEADFKPCSYGFRPWRRAQDAIAEIHYLGSPARNYEWVFEADIAACFDEIDHGALMQRVRGRIADRRVLGLVRAFLAAGVFSDGQGARAAITGTPQGGILSPLLANTALSVLDEHFTRKWEALGPAWTRQKRVRQGTPAYRLVRYADDFVVMVRGTKADTDALWNELATVLDPIGLRLSAEKSRVCHIDTGLDFLGFRIQRRSWQGRPGKRAVYTYPSRQALSSVMSKVRATTRRQKHRTLADLLHTLNRILRGWCSYFRHGVSKRTFGYLGHFTWWRVVGWLRKRHRGLSWGTLRRRYLHGSEIRADGILMFQPQTVAVTRYRYRGTKIPTLWTTPA